MAKITFNLSKTSLSPGWDPSGLAHDDLWQDFAAGYQYNVVGNSMQYDSLRGSDPASGGASDTFSSAAGSLDLTAHDFSGNVSLDWFGEVAQLSLDSAWNTIKNAYVSSFSGHELALKNWVDAWVALDNHFDHEVFVDGTKRAEISTGSGNDVIWVGVDSNGAGWTNHIKVDSGAGNDHITVALATHDYSGSSFSAAYNPAWTTTEIKAGAGNDVIEGGKNADVIDGGAGDIDVVVLHGHKADYNVSTEAATGITTIADLRAPSANMDGTDHVTNVEILQFDDQATLLDVPDGGHQGPGLFGPHLMLEGTSSATFTYVLPDPALYDTIVSLSVDRADEVTIFVAITVPAGQTTTTFNAVVTGNLDFTVTATLGTQADSAPVVFYDPAGATVSHDSLSEAGAIAFTGVNTDGDNDIAFVALTDIAENRTIEFGGAWSNGAFADPESHWSWAAPSGGITAGTVVRIDHIHTSDSISTNIGTVTGSGDLTGHDEAVFAYTSEITPAGLVTHFLAGISNSTFAASGSSLAGTDLTPGANALEFGNHVDIAEYAGNRNIPHTAHEELALLTAPVNWTSQSGSGDQSHDNVSPEAPFAAGHFDILV